MQPTVIHPNLKPLIISEMEPPMNVTRVTNEDELETLLCFLEEQTLKTDTSTGFDTETTPTKDFYFRRARTLQFGNRNQQFVIDLLCFADNDPEILHSSQGNYGKNITPRLRNLIEKLTPYLTGKLKLVGVSLGFEYTIMYWNFGLRTCNFYDCGLTERCIWAGAHSLKDYGFYSMNEMMERYFGQTVDKELQTSFNLTDPLTDAQIVYAALDTRLPLGIKAVQSVVLSGKKLRDMTPGQQKFYAHLEPKIKGTGEPVILGDNLKEIAEIENDAIGAFEDFHIHGDWLDKERWLARVQKSKDDLRNLIDDVLDPFFLPIVGDKTEISTDAEILEAEGVWKTFNTISAEEIQLKAQIRTAKKEGKEDLAAMLTLNMAELEGKRKADKEIYKTACADMKKKRTKVKNIAKKCEGNALINYGSDKQLIAVLQTMKGLAAVKSLDDEVLEKYEDKGYEVMAAIRKYHGLGKEIGTYGDQWAMEWATKPCKEEGWLNPGDGKLHCVYNQYDAETGRSSSEKPNGQNLPQDKEVRECFVAGPPNEFDPEKEEQVLITCDMAGAELCIIAELAADPIWIGAFSRGEDVHSVGTEILYPEQWPAGTAEGCAYFKLNKSGEPQRFKCKCPEHNKLRNSTKSINFLLAYGGGPSTLAKRIKQPLEVAEHLMSVHENKFPAIWKYLEKSGKDALMMRRSFDMFGRRRLFPEPTWDMARERCKEDKEKKLRIDEDEAEQKIELFMTAYKRKPDANELYDLTHRAPTPNEVGHTMHGMKGGVERQGKNHRIQGTNATIAKRAVGCGYDAEGKPYLWHILPQYYARLVKFVHDELVISCPARFAVQVAQDIQSAFKRAAAEKMLKVEMKSEYNIGKCWSK